MLKKMGYGTRWIHAFIFYGKASSPAYATDPRCQNYDLGNDPDSLFKCTNRLVKAKLK